jgi:acylphosphatase
MLVHKQIIIKGQVENTGFRFHALKGAIRCKINGVVSQKDGKIIIEAEGEQNAIDQFMEWCRQGTRFSRINSVEVVHKEIYGFSDFKIS